MKRLIILFIVFLKSQCLTCPTYSTLSGTTCTCNTGYINHLYTCVTACPTGYVASTSGTYCKANPCATNCSVCDTTKYLCTSCSSGYLYNGSCVTVCPIASTLSGSNCVDFSSTLISNFKTK